MVRHKGVFVARHTSSLSRSTPSTLTLLTELLGIAIGEAQTDWAACQRWLDRPPTLQEFDDARPSQAPGSLPGRLQKHDGREGCVIPSDRLGRFAGAEGGAGLASIELLDDRRFQRPIGRRQASTPARLRTVPHSSPVSGPFPAPGNGPPASPTKLLRPSLTLDTRSRHRHWPAIAPCVNSMPHHDLRQQSDARETAID